jgi:sigma-E factor negative regulatory protein RseB
VRAGADDPRVWLEKMNQALATRNYDGTFFHLSDGRVETMRIVHRVLAGRSPSGLSSGRFGPRVRAQQRRADLLPARSRRRCWSSRARSAARSWDRCRSSAPASTVLSDRVAARRTYSAPARVIAVNPKDQFRFGYRLWLDEKSAMPLKTQLCDARGQVIEQILFARLDMPDTHSGQRVGAGGSHRGHALGAPGRSTTGASPDLPGYRASELPPGFHLTVAGAQTLGGAGVPAAHLVYSDGLATVSVFVEARPCCKSGPSRRSRRSRRCRAWARRIGIRLFDRRAGPSSDRGRRGSRADRGVHRPFGQVRRSPRPEVVPTGASEFPQLLEAGLRHLCEEMRGRNALPAAPS